MRFLGVQLEGFATFDRQFVSLRPGLNILVGKNNAGKTAALRALQMLAFLGSRSSLKTDLGLGPYCRNGAGFFDLIAIFRIEVDDAPIFDGFGAFGWADFVRLKDPILAYKFRFKKDQNVIGLLGIELWASQWPSVSLMSVQKNGVFAQIRAAPPTPEAGPGGVIRTDAIASDARIQIPDGTWAATAFGGRWEAPLNLIRNVRFVSAHRVVSPSMPLATVNDIGAGTSELGPYLATLLNNNRKKFQEVEKFFVAAFPEFDEVIPASESNQVVLRFRRRGSADPTPLSYCGTGVEQLLSLATAIIATQPGSIVLLDEPHSFLHPSAERAFLQFIEPFQESSFVVATHSAVTINSVPSDRVTYLEEPGTPFSRDPKSSGISGALYDLGYRNSDALFYDQLVLVEGPSDAAILPCLFSLSPAVKNAVLVNTGFPILDGTSSSAIEMQTKILRFEDLIESIGRAQMPRVYLLDGDRSLKQDDRNLLQGTRNRATGEPVRIRFLRRTEIENYLLVPEAIRLSLLEEAALAGVVIDPEPTVDAIAAKVDELLATDDEVLFPQGKTNNLKECVKGSKLLQMVYRNFNNLVYDKNKSGQIIAKHITEANVADINEILGELEILTKP